MFRLKAAHEPATRAAATCFASHVVVPHRQLSWNSRRSRLRTPDARVPTLGICRCLPNLPNGRCTKSRPLFFSFFLLFRCVALLHYDSPSVPIPPSLLCTFCLTSVCHVRRLPRSSICFVIAVIFARYADSFLVLLVGSPLFVSFSPPPLIFFS